MKTRVVGSLYTAPDGAVIQVWNKRGKFRVCQGFWYEDKVLEYIRCTGSKRKVGRALPGYELRIEVRDDD